MKKRYIHAWLRKEENTALCVLGAMILVYTIVFTYVPWTQQDAFATFGFDLGYGDNRIWLVNQYISGNIGFNDLFSTVGGMHMMGNHVEPIMFLLAPSFWIWSDVKIILFLQTFIIALGAIPVYLLARDVTKNRFVALIFAFSYLMYPALQYMNLFHFHSEALATTFLLFAFYFATKSRYGIMILFSVLAIMTKEDIALVTLFLGIYVAIKHDRKFGALLAALSIIWFVIAIKFILPAYSGVDSGFIFQYRYGAFGNTFGAAATKAVTDPAFTFDVFMKHQGPRYGAELLAPTAFIGLLSPETLAISLPMFAENVFSAHPLQQTINYQYTAAITPFIFISLIYGYARLVRWKPHIWKLLAAVIFAIAVFANISMSPSLISTHPAYYVVPAYANELQAAVYMVPADARISAHYAYVPHLSHRRYIYEFPNPFKCNYWGARCENQHDPATIEYVMLNKDVMPPEWRQIVDRLLVTDFRTIYETDHVLLLKRSDA